MSGYLLDTSCVSEMVRPKPKPRLMEWMETADEGLFHLSVLTLGEIRKGVAGLAPGRRRTRLEAWVDVNLRARLPCNTLPGTRNDAPTQEPPGHHRPNAMPAKLTTLCSSMFHCS